MDDIATLQLSAYTPRQIDIVCRRCKRTASAETAKLRRRYGDRPLGELARLVAADGNPPCELAKLGDGCSVHPMEPPFEQWATLSDARLGGWVGWLACGRKYAALKPTKSCPGEFMVDVHSLLMVLPYDFPLAKLPLHLMCPECQAQRVLLRWEKIQAPAPTAPARRSAGMGRGGLRVVR
ncbi:MAG: hypothetical protein EOP24_16175 [Hyphomicrobiales bacterium]|nr:MAG: hypothetical protein EOP24_16175 [Hyphomicrobiales bacterium]